MQKRVEMKYFIYSFLAYWVYHRFFAPKPRRYYDDAPPRQYQNPAARQPSATKKEDSDFIEYEEVK